MLDKFPVEILNEIRAVFSHIAKVYVCDSQKVAKYNIEKAKGHIKRAQLDAFKYMCYAYSKYYKEFRDLYKNVDLSYVNNGEFIIELSRIYNAAIKKSEEARRIESMAAEVVEAYEAYEDAYNEYAELYKLIKDNLLTMVKLQQKEKLQKDEFTEKINELNGKITDLQQENEQEKKKSKKYTWISIGLAILSVILGVVALV